MKIAYARVSTKQQNLDMQLTAQDCEEKVFTFNNIKRKAYRPFITAAGLQKPEHVTIPRIRFIVMQRMMRR